MTIHKPIAIALLLALLAGCGTAPLSNALPAAGHAQSVRTRVLAKVDTDFDVVGRNIYVSRRPAGTPYTQRNPAARSAVKFFIKGIVYSPTPIGKTVGDLPLLDDSLRDANKPIWSRDLPLMRAMGANAIHVYNVVPPPYDKNTGPITEFLNAAWNGGQKPVYVLMSVYFKGDALLNNDAVQALATQYHDLDQKYAKFPAVLGVTISNEIGAGNYLKNATWWKNFNIVANAAKKGFIDGGDPDKIVTTSEADGNIGSVVAGEKYGAAVDAWGINVYRGRTFTDLFSQIQSTTKKPVLFTEYGASAAYHPGLTNTYTWPNTPTGIGYCTPDEPAGSTTNLDVKELPKTGNPRMAGLVDYVANNAELLYSGFKNNAVVSGGFYFEWTDEWWKAGQGDPSIHYGNVAFNGAYPGCNNDEGWYGLNSVSKGSGALNVLTPRPTLGTLKEAWSRQP